MNARNYWNWMRRFHTTDPRPAPLRSGRSRKQKGRKANLQQLEPRELLTASMQIFDGTTQLSTWGSDSFPTSTVGDVATKAFTINDVGDQDLSITSVELPTGFSLDTSLPLDVPAGGSSSLVVSMDTSSATNYDGTMEIDSDDPDSPFYLNLSGTVSGTPSLNLSDGSTQLFSGGTDSLGSVNVGDNESKYFTITNSGTDVLNVNSLTLPSGFYTYTSFPLSVDPGQSANFDVDLYTDGPGQFSGVMTIGSNDPANGNFNVSLSATVQQPAAPSLTLRDGSTTLTNGSDDTFGSVYAGSVASKTFSVSNSGDASLSVSSISLPTGFSLASGTSLPIDLPPGQSSTFVVQMDTNSANSYYGTMELDSNDSNNSPLDVYFDGTVNTPPSPDMQLAANWNTLSNAGSYGFGTANVGDTVSTDFELSNSGSGPLTVSSISLPSGFALAGGRSLPITVAASGTADFTVTMNTSAAAILSGQMVLHDNDSADDNDPFTVDLTGTVVVPTAPSMQVSLGSTTLSNGGNIDFGTVTEGASDSQTLAISNSGNATLRVSSLTLPGGFTSSTSLPLTIAPGQSSSLVISLDTSAATAAYGQLEIGDNDATNDPFTLNLSGTVAPPPPALSLHDGTTAIPNGSGSDSFGTTVLGTAIERTLTIENSAPTSIDLTAGSLSLPAGFSLKGSFPTSVPGDGTAAFVVQMDATQPGDDEGEASFSDADPGGGTYQFSLWGMVTAPSMNVTCGDAWLTNGGSYNLGSTIQGEPIDATFDISNQGDGPLSLTSISLMLPPGFSLQGAFPTSVAAGATASFTVQLDAKSAASFAGTLTFDDSDPQNSPFSLTLSGTVAVPSGAIAVSDDGMPIDDGASQVPFGDTDANIPATQTITISNTGPATLTLDPSTISLPKGYSVVTPFDAAVAPGTSTNLVFELDSSQGGDYAGIVSFTTGDLNHLTFSFLVDGNVNPPEPAIEVSNSTSQLSNGDDDFFGSTTIRNPLEQSLTLTNTGSAPLSLDANSMAVPAGFNVVTPFAATVAPGASTTLVLELTAAAAGSPSGSLSFSDNVPGSGSFTLTLSGQVTAPVMTVTNAGTAIVSNQSTIDFGSTPVGSPVTETLIIGNSGSADLTLDPQSLVLPAGYSVLRGFGSDVPPGGSTTLMLQLNATSPGTVKGQATFNDNAPNASPFGFNLTGTVLVGGLTVYDGSTLLANGQATESFASTPLGTPVERTLTLENTGGAPLSLDQASLSLPAGYSVVTPFATSIAAGASTTLVLSLSAQTAGVDQGTLSFATSDPNNRVFNLNLFGQVTLPKLAVQAGGATLANGGSVDLGGTPVGSPVEATITLANQGGAPLTIDASSLSAPAGFKILKMPAASVGPGAGDHDRSRVIGPSRGIVFREFVANHER